MTFVLLLAIFFFAAAAVSLVQTLTARREIRASLDRAAGIAAAAPAPGLAIRGRRLPFAERFARLALAARPGTGREDVALRLGAAGLARRVSADAYLAAQGAALAGSLAFGLLLLVAGSPGNGIVLGSIGAGLAVLAPDRLLAARAARRRNAVLAELPGALDLLCVSVEAGLGFDAALARIADAIEGPLAEEFNNMLSEIRVGEARPVALQRLADRLNVPDVSSFVRAVLRADQLGTSLAQTLRVQAADARARRQLAAEEQAGKAPVKMLFPTIIFIFPALFVVVLGPSLLSISGFLK
jgi:tight adherence protein C